MERTKVRDRDEWAGFEERTKMQKVQQKDWIEQQKREKEARKQREEEEKK